MEGEARDDGAGGEDGDGLKEVALIRKPQYGQLVTETKALIAQLSSTEQCVDIFVRPPPAPRITTNFSDRLF